MIAEYLEHALQFELLAAAETDLKLKADLEKQATAYRKLAEERNEKARLKGTSWTFAGLRRETRGRIFPGVSGTVPTWAHWDCIIPPMSNYTFRIRQGERSKRSVASDWPNDGAARREAEGMFADMARDLAGKLKSTLNGKWKLLTNPVAHLSA